MLVLLLVKRRGMLERVSMDWNRQCDRFARPGAGNIAE
jgi:hypothetical protein